MQLAYSVPQNYFTYENHLWNSSLIESNDLTSCHCIRLQQLCRLWRLVLGSEMPHTKGLFQENVDFCTRVCKTQISKFSYIPQILWTLLPITTYHLEGGKVCQHISLKDKNILHVGVLEYLTISYLIITLSFSTEGIQQ